jgi:hypothetical protein
MRTGLTFLVAGIHFNTHPTRIPLQVVTTLLCSHQRDVSVAMATTNSIKSMDNHHDGNGGDDHDAVVKTAITTTPRIDAIERGV